MSNADKIRRWLRERPWLVPSAIVVAVLIGVYQAVLGKILSPALWIEILDLSKSEANRGAIGNIFGGIIGGMLTIVAAISTILWYTRQQKVENLKTFFEWLSEFNSTFHADEAYGEVREALATKRQWVRRQLLMEMLMDGNIRPDQLLSQDKQIESDVEQIRCNALDWKFLRKFTDYLYFFEQVLAFGESLAKRDTIQSAPALVDHFGWFLRSLCVCWGDERMSREDKNRAAGIFVVYLANNRYRRLTEVALMLLDWGGTKCGKCKKTGRCSECKEIEARSRNIMTMAGEVMTDQNANWHKPSGPEDLWRRWKHVIGNKGIVLH
jgi:hypothetical protein